MNEEIENEDKGEGETKVELINNRITTIKINKRYNIKREKYLKISEIFKYSRDFARNYFEKRREFFFSIAIHTTYIWMMSKFDVKAARGIFRSGERISIEMEVLLVDGEERKREETRSRGLLAGRLAVKIEICTDSSMRSGGGRV